MSVIQIRIGTPEAFVPSAFAPKPLCDVIRAEASPDASVKGKYHLDGKLCSEYGIPSLEAEVSPRGLLLKMPMDHECGVYGLGLQLKSFQHRGGKKTLRVNADPDSNSGDSHAPVPFFVTTAGFGLYLDTARTVSYHFSRQFRRENEQNTLSDQRATDHTADLYAVREKMSDTYLVAEIPFAQGLELCFITGGSILEIVSEYNLLSGGGCLPPVWGLGVFYRCYQKFTGDQVVEMAENIRQQGIPCDVIGLEPGWQSHSYSCSHKWNAERYPRPEETVRKLIEAGYRVNLWGHAFTHPTAAIFDSIAPYSADMTVWGGLVPDFTLEKAREIFADELKKHVALGVTGFKLDECDGSDFTGGWTFPDCSRFPSGMDGEQYHHLFGTLYAQTVLQALGENETLSQVRNMGALCASYPFILYSDLYDQKDFLTGVVNAGFSGILWSPEVREAGCTEELLRRIQLVVFSHQALVNAWYLERTPWEDLGCTDAVRSLFEWRMRLIPYLYTAFADYRETGKPPIRALVCDFQDEKETWDCADEYLFGDSMIVAPILYPEKERSVFLPEGTWYDLFTGEQFRGGTHQRATDGVPVYVKEGTVLPLANPARRTDESQPFEIVLHAYGNCEGKQCRLAEGENPDGTPEYVAFTPDQTEGQSRRYRIIGVEYH